MDAWCCGKVSFHYRQVISQTSLLFCAIYIHFYMIKTSLPVFWVVGYSEEKFPQWDCRFSCLYVSKWTWKNNLKNDCIVHNGCDFTNRPLYPQNSTKLSVYLKYFLSLVKSITNVNNNFFVDFLIIVWFCEKICCRIRPKGYVDTTIENKQEFLSVPFHQ